MLTFRFTGADGCMTVSETLTTGMVGKQVKLEFSSAWDKLQKTAVFMGGNTVRVVRNAGEIIEIPHEVLKKPLSPLYIGVYGVSEDGSIVVPTIRVQGPTILPGANPAGDEQTEPTLPVWASMEQEIALLRKQLENTGSLSDGQISALDGMFRVCAYDGDADYDKANAAFKAAFGIGDSKNSGEGENHTHRYTSAVTTAATCETAGVKTYTCTCGERYTESILATGHNYVDGVCTVCGAADPDADSGEAADGVSSIKWFTKNASYGTDNVNNTWGVPTATTVLPVEPDNGYLVTGHDTTGLTAIDSASTALVWPLIGGKTYCVTVSDNNADSVTAFLSVWVGTISGGLQKGIVNEIVSTVGTKLIDFRTITDGGSYSATHTAASGEWLFAQAGAANILTITAEVTA